MRSALGVFVIALVLPALLLTTGHAAAFCEILEPPSSLPTRVNGTQVEIQLTDGFARVVIIKEFYNPSDEFKQGQVFFPLEKGHELITDLRLKVGNVVYNSSSGDRGGALDDFLNAVQKGQDAALVQYDPPRDVYWIAVTIPPHEARTTITTLEMPLVRRDGFYDYHYRLSVDARDSVDYLHVHVRLETAAPLHVHLASHPGIPILRSGDRVADVFLNDSASVEGRDLQIHFGSLGPSISQFVDTDGSRYIRYALGAQDPAFQSSLAPLPRSLLVALDTSASMGRDGRLATAQSAVRGLADDLRRGETFGLIAFGGPSVRAFDPELRPATPDLAPDLVRFLDTLSPGGSTSLTAAVPTIDRWATDAWARGAQPVFVLVSDGRPNRGVLGRDLEQAYSRISVDRSLPIYALAVRPSDHPAETLLRNLSHFQGGDLFTVSGEDPGNAAASLLMSVRVPVLEGITAEFPGSPGAEYANPNPQTLMQGGEAVVLAKVPGRADDPVAFRLHWGTADAPSSTERSFTGTEIASQSLLKREWILMRIHGMLAALRAHEEPGLVESLKAFATANRVVTPYTSLLVTIPTAEPAPAEGSRDTALDGSPFGGLLGGPAAPVGAASRTPSFRGPVSPLEEEGQRSAALRRDLANPIVADGEVDRWVPDAAPERAQLDRSPAIVRFDGTYVRVLEVGDELVGVFREGFFPTPLSPSAVGLAIAVASVLGWLGAWQRRRGSPPNPRG